MNKLNLTQLEQKLILNNLKFDLRKQEKIIFEMLYKGYKNNEIAERLNLHPITIWRREKDLLKKINFYLQENENIKDVYCVYIHKFPNNKVYIGMTSNALKRWNNGLGYQNNERMFNDILTYGWNNIEHKIIAENLTYNEALKIEKDKIKEYESYNKEKGYNIKNN